MTSREALLSSASVEWYTPPYIIELCREVLGEIDLDPASCKLANEIIKAKRFYTEEDNGLLQQWNGRSFINPPYSAGGTSKWVDKAEAEFATCFVDLDTKQSNYYEYIMLLNATPDRSWFHKLWKRPICFLDKRIHFLETVEQRIKRISIQMAKRHGGTWENYIDKVPAYRGTSFADGKLVQGPQPTHGNVLVYFGYHTEIFVRHMRPLGHISLPNKEYGSPE